MPSTAQFAALTKTPRCTQPRRRAPSKGTTPLRYDLLHSVSITWPSTASGKQNLVGFNPVGNSRYNNLALQVTETVPRRRTSSTSPAWRTWSHTHGRFHRDSLLHVLHAPPRPGLPESGGLTGPIRRSTIAKALHFYASVRLQSVRPLELDHERTLSVTGTITGTYTYQTDEQADTAERRRFQPERRQRWDGDRTIIKPGRRRRITGSGVTGTQLGRRCGQKASSSASIVAYVSRQ